MSPVETAALVLTYCALCALIGALVGMAAGRP